MRVFQHIFATILLAVWLILRLIKRRGLPITPLNGLLYLGVIAWFASAIFSLDPRMALENLWFPMTNLLFFFVMVDLLQSGQEGLLVETQFLLGALVVILAGVQFGSYLFGWGFGTPTIGWVSVLGPDLRLPLVAPRLYVPIGVSTWLAAYVTPIAILAGAWGLAARRRATRNALWILALLLVVVMLLTGSRGGWVSFGVGAAAFLVLEGLRNERLRQFARRYAIPLLIAATTAVVVSVLVLVHVSADPGHATGDVLRFDLWRGALQITRQYPLFGAGPGLFGLAYRLIRDPLYVDNRLGTAHNFYLNSLAENGIIGIVIVIALGVVLVRAWWKQWRGAETPSRSIHLAGAFAALIGFGVQSVFDTFTGMPLVLLVFVLIAYCITPLRSKLDAPLKGSLAAGLASLIIVLIFGAGLLRSDQAQAAFMNGVKGDPAQAQQAITLDPSLRLYTLETAYSTGLSADTAQGIVAYQQALALEPTWDAGWINLAALYVRQNRTAAALDALQKAINIDNRNGALFLWARLAEQTNSAPPDAIVDAYTRYMEYQIGGNLPLSSFWSQTDLRKQAVADYVKTAAPDLRYRVLEIQDPNPADLAKLVPSNPVSPQDWWIVGEYALMVEKDAAKAEAAFTKAIQLDSDAYRGDYFASRARARLSSDPQGAARDLNIADLLGTLNESPNAIRAQMTTSVDQQRKLWAAAVTPRVIDQNFEGVLFAGRVAQFDTLPEMRFPGPGQAAMQPWFDLAASDAASGQIVQAEDVYRAILDRAPEETEAQEELDKLTGSASS